MTGLAATTDPPWEEHARTLSLHAATQSLVLLATRLRQGVPADPAATKQALAGAVDRFERELEAAGWDARGVAAASYLLCAWLDEVVAGTPWGGHNGAALLERFHGEAEGGDRVMRLLSRLAERPQENLALLELFHACLSLGLAGPWRGRADAAPALEQLRARVFALLPPRAPALAPPWHPAVKAAPTGPRRRLVVGALIALALGALATYSTAQVLLARRVDLVFAAMHQLSATPGPPPAASAPAVDRLASRLAADMAAGRARVLDETYRSVVSLPAQELFDGDDLHLTTPAAALLARVAGELAGRSGKVVIVGHTDGRDPRTARLPSAWHRSHEWARAVADQLARGLPAERLAVEGAGDLTDPADAGLPARRVDIVYYP